MYNINPLYTGENSAVKLPELDSIERSSRRNSEMQIRGEEMKLDKALKDKANFQKMLSIDPIMAVSTANATRQAQDLEKYNNKWADKYVKSKGELSFADEMEMSNDRKLLQATQGKMLADQEQYQTYKNTILRDTRGYYDKQNFDNAEQEYFKTGVLPPNMMDIAPQSMETWLQGQKKDIERDSSVEQVPVMSNGKPTGQYQTIQVGKVSLQSAQNTILEGMKEEARLKSVVTDFDNWTKTAPQKEVYDLLKDYDKDKNGVVDPAENQYAHQNTNVTDNPIAKWAMNNPSYLTKIMDVKEGTAKNIPTGKSGTPFNWNTGVNATNNQNGKFDIQKDIPFSTTDDMSFNFPDYMNLGSVSQTGESQEIKERIVKDASGNEKREPVGETMPYHLIGYSPSKDQAVIGIDDKSSKYNYGKGDTMVVPASQVNDLLRKKPFGIFRGQQTAKPIEVKKGSGLLDNL